MTELNDELLVAYADGQLEPGQLRAVERVLTHDPFAAKRVAVLREANSRLETVFDAMLHGDQADGAASSAGPEDAEMEEDPPVGKAPTGLASAGRTLHRIAQSPTARIAGLLTSAGGIFAGATAAARGAAAGGLSATKSGWRRVARVFEPVSLSRVLPEREKASWAGRTARSIDSVEKAKTAFRVAPFWLQATASIFGVIILGGMIGFAIDRLWPTGAVDTVATAALPRSDWKMEAARAQALMSRETLEIGLESQGNLDLVAFQLSKAFGADVVVPNLASHGLAFKRAQLLHHDDQPLAQIAYLAASGGPLVLYMSAEKGEAPPDFRTSGGFSTVSWTEGGLSYLIVGEGGHERMIELLDAVRGARLGLAQ